MKPSRFSHWLRVSVMLALCSLTAYACGGGKFTAGPGASGGDTANAGASGDGSGASGGAPEHKIACQGPEDCDDGNPCTVDQCGADGACTRAPKCGATEKCCDGSCGECCDSPDCDDQVACTDDQCFAGGCSHSPNNSSCDVGQYCSATGGCRHKESCTDDAACDDSDPCTDDACSASLCDHTATQCTGSDLCCPGVGCAECCSDSNCDDKDPCTTDSCSANKCEHAPLCPKGQQCCAASDKSSATCGSTCCAASDCDDSVSCTKDSCTQGTCAHTDDNSCGSGSTCDPKSGCVKTAECKKDSDCKTTNACQTSAKCVSGACTFGDCGGLKCCSDGCKACCGDTDCNDQVACTKDTCNGGVCSNVADSSSCAAATPICDPKLGCLTCNSNADCDDKNDCTTDVCDCRRTSVRPPSCATPNAAASIKIARAVPSPLKRLGRSSASYAATRCAIPVLALPSRRPARSAAAARTAAAASKRSDPLLRWDGPLLPQSAKNSNFAALAKIAQSAARGRTFAFVRRHNSHERRPSPTRSPQPESLAAWFLGTAAARQRVRSDARVA